MSYFNPTSPQSSITNHRADTTSPATSVNSTTSTTSQSSDVDSRVQAAYRRNKEKYFRLLTDTKTFTTSPTPPRDWDTR